MSRISFTFTGMISDAFHIMLSHRTIRAWEYRAFVACLVWKASELWPRGRLSILQGIQTNCNEGLGLGTNAPVMAVCFTAYEYMGCYQELGTSPYRIHCNFIFSNPTRHASVADVP